MAVACCLLLAACRNETNTVTPAHPVSASSPSTRPANRLAREKSPYLLQHQHNPVDWFPWGEEAFAKARAEDKPILLSIGYSTCHWCHVMERESFEDEATAAVLNRHFVAIKVDREERPDVDRIYMMFVQNMTGSGGWPLNVFLTPDLKPFYGGTYWPPAPRHGRPAFVQVLEQVRSAWIGKRAEIAQSADQMHGQLAAWLDRHVARPGGLNPALLAKAAAELKEGYDPVHGGWGRAPKFPSPSHPAFVLQQGVRRGDPEAVEMVLHTCDRMAAGGIHDQLGGGFARYSVDEKWLVPHFEKMLYDNAQLLGLYLDCFLVSGEAAYADVARGIVRYLLRDLRHPEGGFYSAEDADSEGKEGKFYCWTQEELRQCLTAEEFDVAVRAFGVTARGNFLDHSDPEPLPDQNVLSMAAGSLRGGGGPSALLESARAKLLAVRGRRVRPHLDDKILASWNGLLLGPLARAGLVLDDPACREAALANYAFVRARLWDPATRTLHNRWREGERDTVQLLDAYAFLLGGVVELYQVTLQEEHLQFALELADGLLARFHDAEDGGFWQSPAGAGDLILRLKEAYDGAEPSGNSVATLALLKLAAITGRQDYRAAADKALGLFAQRLQQMPQAVPHLLMALDFALEEPRRVVIADGDGSASLALLRAAHGVYQPGKVVLANRGPVEPFARTLSPKDGKPTAYVCTGTACQPPTHEPGQVAALLK
ncbi:MAG: hypothetical protein RJA22_641 [Verrucomicrobiota bacterium]